MVRVSVIVPTFNYGNFIAETVSSVLAQSFSDFELLVNDNASTDGTGVVLDGFSDPRLHYRYFDQNVGLYPNVERGIAEASGDYIVIVGADDVLEQDFLKRAVERLDQEHGLSMVHGAAVWIDEKGEPFGGTNDRWQELTPGTEAVLDIFRYGFCLATMVVRTTTARQLMPFPRDWADLADAWLFLNLCLRGDIGYLHPPVVRCRVHQRSLTSTLCNSGELFDRHLGMVKNAFDGPEMKSRGLHHRRRAALRSIARESIRLLHSTRLVESRWVYLRSFWRITASVPSVLAYPETWFRLGFGMLPSGIINTLSQWRRMRRIKSTGDRYTSALQREDVSA